MKLNLRVFAEGNPITHPKSPPSKRKRLVDSEGVILFPEDTIDDLIQKIDLIDTWVEKAKKKDQLIIYILGDYTKDHKNLIEHVYPKLFFIYLVGYPNE